MGAQESMVEDPPEVLEVEVPGKDALCGQYRLVFPDARGIRVEAGDEADGGLQLEAGVLVGVKSGSRAEKAGARHFLGREVEEMEQREDGNLVIFRALPTEAGGLPVWQGKG
eukprot:Hpha_TRINITY_DN7014_c0_g1::TRINITY_DN7014_c0_g1_i1::g.22880::m.22880